MFIQFPLDNFHLQNPSTIIHSSEITLLFSSLPIRAFQWPITSSITLTCVTYLAYTRKNAQVVAILMKTGLNNVLLPTLFIAVNNIEQYCYTRFRLNNIVQYCWKVWTTWAAKHCSVLLSNGLGVFCHVVENRLEQCFAAHIVHSCQQYWTILLHPIQAQQYCSILLTSVNNVGSKTLFKPVFNNIVLQAGVFCCVDYLSWQQLWYYFLNCVYPNPPCQLSLWEEIGAPGENPRLSAERWLTLFTWVRGENPTHELRGEMRLLWPTAPPKPPKQACFPLQLYFLRGNWLTYFVL